MSLYPFPARNGDIPPPVPPKPSAVAHIASCAIPSLSKAISFESFVNLYTSRNNSPIKQLEKLDTSMSPLADSPTLRQVPTMMSPRDCSSPETPNSPPRISSLASAKHRAKGVFNTRRKGSNSDLETMTTVQEYCMDSPTIPGRPAVCQNDPPVSWRNHAFSDVLLSSISPPQSLSTSPIDLACIDRPISPLCLPSLPDTPWPGVKLASNNISDKIREYYESTYELPPAVPPKASLQKAPAFLENIKPSPIEKGVTFEREKPTEAKAVVKYMERPMSPPVIERTRKHYAPLRPRADSAPPVRTFSPRRGDKLQIPERPGSADPMEPPVKRHRRKKSSISNTLPQGVRPSKAPTHFPYSQLESIQSAAKLRGENFGVLNAKDVDGLSKELSGKDVDISAKFKEYCIFEREFIETRGSIGRARYCN